MQISQPVNYTRFKPVNSFETIKHGDDCADLNYLKKQEFAMN